MYWNPISDLCACLSQLRQTIASGCHEDGGVHKEVNDVQHFGVLSVSNVWVLYILHKSHVLQRYVFCFCDTWRRLVQPGSFRICTKAHKLIIWKP